MKLPNRLLLARLCPTVGLLLCLASPATSQGETVSGEKLYKAQCARCHGPQGEGSKHYKPRLEGDRSVAQLASLIQKTMPENAPGSLSKEEAQAVAGYIHEAFYSPIARERNRPARIELARLTVRQYRHAVADLIGSFRGQRAVREEPGLRGEYYKNRRFRPQERVLSRSDPQVNFDFGTESPVPGKMEPHEFSIRWSGSVLAPETGLYEIVIQTEHAARLWLNDEKRPLIDAWVKSGNDTEYRGSLFLVGGRYYPLRLEYSKAKQGVDDSKKNKDKPKPAVKSSIKLLWKAPHRVLEPIPARQLVSGRAAEVFVCSTPFPPDDRSYGWERGTTISKEWDQATTDAALEAAAYVQERLEELSGVRERATDRKQRLQAFCQTFAERAYRRPLTEVQKALVQRQFEVSKDPETAVKRVVLLTLKSPWFLYREVAGGSDGYDVAARLSFGLWDSIPDLELLSAAKAGKLTTREEVARQAERMLNDPRAKAKLREFLLIWLKADHGLDLAKDAKKFPGFDGRMIADLRTSLELFLEDVIWSEKSDFRRLFLAEEIPLNGRLARFYGADLPAESDFQPVKLEEGKRAGVLSHPYLMTSFAHNGESSPIHRGVFLARGVLGLSLRPPPEAVAPLAPSLHPELTTRERVELQTKPNACMSCHGIINPLGFTLEHFDAVGRYREKDNDKPVDARGSYQTREGKIVKVNGVRELASFLAESPEAQAAFVEQLFHHLHQQPVRAYGANTQQELQQAFREKDFHIRKLVLEVMTQAALKPRQVRLQEPSSQRGRP